MFLAAYEKLLEENKDSPPPSPNVWNLEKGQDRGFLGLESNAVSLVSPVEDRSLASKKGPWENHMKVTEDRVHVV